MNMGLMAADLSLGRAISERDSIAKQQQQQHQPLLPDLHALEVYHKALEDERQKIQAFERELPFCMQLLDDAIEASREQLEDRLTCKLNTPQPPQFLCNYTSLRSSLPALGEINMSFKRKWKAEDDPLINRQTKWLLNQNTSEDQQTAITEDTSQTIKGCITLQEYVKSDHVQAVESQKASLVISSNDKILASKYTSLTNPHPINSEINPRLSKDQQDYNKPISVIDLEKDHHPISALPRSINATNHSPSAFSRSISITNLSKELPISALSPLTKTSSGSLQSVQRKPRRCWSPELHQRFLSALNHLGGCQVATPKQIRELMNVEGLTNDEVKSHLQKFRLHMRRPNNIGNAQADSQQAAGHHLVVFGHIWVPPEYGDDQQQANGSIISNNSSDHGALELVKSFNNHSISNNDSTNRAPLMRLCQGTDYSTEQQHTKAPQIQSLNEDEAAMQVVGKGSLNKLIMQAGENAGSMEGQEADHGFIVKRKTACVQLQLHGDIADDHDHDAAAITTRANEIGLSIACSSSSNDINDNNNNNNGITREASCS